MKTKQSTFGTGYIEHTSPDVSKIPDISKSLNVIISFENALKLNLAISECVRRLNSFNRSSTDGKRSALNLTLYLRKGRFTVNLGKLKKSKEAGKKK